MEVYWKWITLLGQIESRNLNLKRLSPVMKNTPLLVVLYKAKGRGLVDLFYKDKLEVGI